jgi:ferredoxin
VRLSIDPEACAGHGRCYALFPDLFEGDDEGTGVVTCPHPSPAQEEAARLAVVSCPEGAITLTDDAEDPSTKEHA